MPATWNALSHVTTHHLFSLPHRHRDDAIRDPKNKLSLECHKVPCLPREMHFHTSQHITFSRFPVDTATTRLETPKTNFRLSATKSHACHVKCTFTRHNTSPFLTFPIDSGDVAIRAPRHENDRQNSPPPPDPQERKQKPFATHLEKSWCHHTSF